MITKASIEHVKEHNHEIRNPYALGSMLAKY